MPIQMHADVQENAPHHLAHASDGAEATRPKAAATNNKPTKNQAYLAMALPHDGLEIKLGVLKHEHAVAEHDAAAALHPLRRPGERWPLPHHYVDRHALASQEVHVIEFQLVVGHAVGDKVDLFVPWRRLLQGVLALLTIL